LTRWPSGCWLRAFSRRSRTGARWRTSGRWWSMSWRPGLVKTRVASTADLPAESMLRVEVSGVPICLVHAEDGNFYALGDTCTHEEDPLSEGELWEMSGEGRGHGSRFDVRTGNGAGGPPGLPEPPNTGRCR